MGLFEVAFKADPNGEFYKKYKVGVDERAKFRKLAFAFSEAHLEEDSPRVRQYIYLECSLTPSEYERYKGSELKSNKNQRGLHVFKKKSRLNQLWLSEVSGAVDYNAINWLDTWMFGHFDGRVQYNLWMDGDDLYGWLSGHNLTVPDGCEQIKLSAYHTIIEEWEARQDVFGSES